MMIRPISCSSALGALPEYMADALDAQTRQCVHAHLDSCQRCAAEFAQRGDVAAYLSERLQARADAQRAPADAWRTLQARLASDAHRPMPFKLHRVVMTVGAGLTSLLIATVSMLGLMRFNPAIRAAPTQFASQQRIYVPAMRNAVIPPLPAEPFPELALPAAIEASRQARERQRPFRFGGLIDIVSDSLIRVMPERAARAFALTPERAPINGLYYTFDDIVPDFFCTECSRLL